ncbi:hypothetical protein UFOVP250_72 [uncultured Caudovirales phage]|uniref:Uncharacterized protein n=1 Tax=uncultured Caudovirales phage TaxID=2100421 RepID=A0A6J5LEX2_9CAUD|nr:hypothetical protein UFOVP250_72 [uncultured Caudovirales phage]
MGKEWLKIASGIVNIGLIIVALYLAWYNKDYAQASFLLLLVMLNKE